MWAHPPHLSLADVLAGASSSRGFDWCSLHLSILEQLTKIVFLFIFEVLLNVIQKFAHPLH